MSALRKVLVVDDDPVVAKSIERTLSPNHIVVTASSGEEALSKLAQGDYDVVFTDIKMPGMDGIELTKEIKATKAWTPVVIITGYGNAKNQQEASELGVVDFIQKPLNPEIIEAATQKAIFYPYLEEAPAWGIKQEIVPPRQIMKNLGMLMAAPFIGLAYALALPFVGLGTLMWMGGTSLYKKVA